MNTKSAVIIWLVKIFTKLGYYFEYSFIYKLLAAIGKVASGSKIIGNFINSEPKDYSKGSLILRPLIYIAGVFMAALKKLFALISRANQTSLNKKLFDTAIIPLKTVNGIISALCLTLGGIMLVVGIGNFGSITMVIGLVSGVGLIFSGVFLADFLTTAFKGCFPMKLLQWFFDEE